MNTFIQNLKAKNLKKTAGFTLIEILVVIGIIAILAAIVIIAINPAKQFAQARNTQRQAGVNAILNAVGQRLADNKGIFAGSFTVGTATYVCPTIPVETTSNTASTDVSTTTLTAAATTGEIGCLVPTYIASIPTDPDTSFYSSPLTGYKIGVDGSGRITVCAPRASTESSIPGAAAICVTR